jgi:hypothetical protein
MYEHETPPASLVISIFMLQYTFVCSTPKHLTFLYPKKSLCFFGQLSDRCHNSSKVFYEAFIKLCHCNQKERVRKYTAQRLPSTNPGVHVLLNYSTQFRPPKIHNSLTAYWIITRSKTCKSFAPTQQQSRCYSIRPLPRLFTQMSTKGNFLITL